MKVVLRKTLKYDEGYSLAQGLEGELKIEGINGWPMFKVNGVGEWLDLAIEDEEIFQYFKRVK